MLLLDLIEAEGSTEGLVGSTGLSERTVRRGLHRLIGSGHVFSPARGRYRLTLLGDAMASELAGAAVASARADAPPVLPGYVAPMGPRVGVPGWAWVAVGALAAVAVLGANKRPQLAQRPPATTPGPRRVGPYGWRGGY